MNRQNSKSLKIGYISIIFATILAGSISTVAKSLLTNVEPIILAAFVYLLIALVSTLMPNKIKIRLIKKKEWLQIILISIFGSIIAPTLFYMGLTKTTASDTSLLTIGETIFSILIALIFFKEKLKPVGYVAVVIVLIGVVIVTTNLQFSNLADLNEGSLLILAAMAFWSLDNNISRNITWKIDVSRVIQLKSLLGGTILVIFAFAMNIPIKLTLIDIPSVMFLGIAGSGASLYFFLHSLKRIGTVRTVLIFSTSSVFGLGFAFLFLHEKIGIYHILAVAMMLFGIYLVEKKGMLKSIIK